MGIGQATVKGKVWVSGGKEVKGGEVRTDGDRSDSLMEGRAAGRDTEYYERPIPQYGINDYRYLLLVY